MRITEAILVIATLALFVSWLGGGRKWTFRTMLSLLILALLGGSGFLLYTYRTEKFAERRAQELHECAIDKIARAQCEQQPAETGPWEKYREKTDDSKGKDRAKTDVSKEVWHDVCPLYALPENPTVMQETAALTAAEEACQAEMNPTEKTLHEQVSEYRRAHGIKEPVRSDVDDASRLDALAGKAGAIKNTLGTAACAAKVRKKYPGAYDSLDDATLTRKVLAKYPRYCEAKSGGPGFEPVIEGIR